MNMLVVKDGDSSKRRDVIRSSTIFFDRFGIERIMIGCGFEFGY
jgi:hypothetical protein